MLITDTRNRYQEGALERAPRAKGPHVWVYRWRERSADGKRVQRKRVIGTVDALRTLTDAKRASDNIRLAANATGDIPAAVKLERPTIGTAWGHFQLKELSDPDVGRSPTTIDGYHQYFKSQILPRWRDVPLDEVKAVSVEKWLRSLTDLAPATRAKIRNHLSALFAHAIRHELYAPALGVNPIASVRQGSKRRQEPEVLSLEEIGAILDGIDPPAIKMMVALAAASALRRSEIRGLRWSDCDLGRCWFSLKTGVVRKHQTKLKTEASRRGIPMLPELADALLKWRQITPYNQDEDWVFASPFTKGVRPFWPETALKNHVRPAAVRAKISKLIGWHTFRHSLGTLMDNQKESLKTVQALLRHASSRVTADLYLHGDDAAKRSALTHTSSLFQGVSLLPAVAN